MHIKVVDKNTKCWSFQCASACQVALVRYDGTMYDGFYDRHLLVTVSSEPGSSSSGISEDKQIFPDDNIFDYQVTPGTSDRVIRVTVSIISLLTNV